MKLVAIGIKRRGESGFKLITEENGNRDSVRPGLRAGTDNRDHRSFCGGVQTDEEK